MTITDYLLLINWDQIPSSPASYWIPFNTYLLHVNTGNMWGYKVKTQFLPSKELTVYRDWHFMYRNTYVIYRNTSIKIYSNVPEVYEIYYITSSCCTVGRESTCNAGGMRDAVSVLASGWPLGRGNDNPL